MATPRTKPRTTGHQALLERCLRKYGGFYWADWRPFVPVNTAFRDAIYKAVERLRARGWIIHERRGRGYVLVKQGK